MKRRLNLTIDSKLYDRVEDYAKNTRRTVTSALEWLLIKGLQSELEAFKYYLHKPFKDNYGADEVYRLISDYLESGQVHEPLAVHVIDDSIYFMNEHYEATLFEMINKENFIKITLF